MHGSISEQRAQSFYMSKCRADKRHAQKLEGVKQHMKETVAKICKRHKLAFKEVGDKFKLVVRKGLATERISLEHGVEMGFACRFSLAAMEKQHGASRKTFLRAALLVATAYLHYQLKLLEAILTLCLAINPDYVFIHSAWGETGERLSMQSKTPEGGVQTDTSVWQVLICRLCLCYGTLASGPRFYQIVVPPLQIPTTSAEWIYRGLYWHTFTYPIWQLLEKILSTATFCSMRIEEADYASSNDKMFHYLLSHGKKQEHQTFGLLHDFKPCHNHQNHHIMLVVFALVGLRVRNSQFQLANASRAGGYFFRLHEAGYGTVRRLLKPVYVGEDHAVPECYGLYAAEAIY